MLKTNKSECQICKRTEKVIEYQGAKICCDCCSRMGETAGQLGPLDDVIDCEFE